MNSVLLLLALTVGQAEPTRETTPKIQPRENPRLVRPNTAPEPAAKGEEQLPFTLDVLSAGAKNDAFVDEFLKEKKLSLYGTVQAIERFSGDEDVPPRYRLVMNRVGRDDRATDVEVFCYFPAASRKGLSLLEPEITKITVEGNCTKATLHSLDKGLGFQLVLEDCKIIPTPAALQAPQRAPPSAIIPNIIDPASIPRLPITPPQP